MPIVALVALSALLLPVTGQIVSNGDNDIPGEDLDFKPGPLAPVRTI